LKARFPRFAHRKGVVIPNCVIIDSVESMSPGDKHDPFVLMVAQHRANKNIPLAIKVFEELLQREKIAKNTILLVVGSYGPETATIRDLIDRRSLQKNVQLKIGVNDGELRWLYENCELLIAPSWTEGFGLPVVEGLLCGSRVVCSDISAFREVSGQACHFFDLHAESAASSMFAAVCKALTEPVREPEGLERFTLNNVAKEYAALYAQLIEDALGVVETCEAP
jgi:glycosyltransferase involved in cell wall biosynthesis